MNHSTSSTPSVCVLMSCDTDERWHKIIVTCTRRFRHRVRISSLPACRSIFDCCTSDSEGIYFALDGVLLWVATILTFTALANHDLAYRYCLVLIILMALKVEIDCMNMGPRRKYLKHPVASLVLPRSTTAMYAPQLPGPRALPDVSLRARPSTFLH